MTKFELELIKICVDTLFDIARSGAVIIHETPEIEEAQRILDRELFLKRYSEQWPRMD